MRSTVIEPMMLAVRTYVPSKLIPSVSPTSNVRVRDVVGKSTSAAKPESSIL